MPDPKGKNKTNKKHRNVVKNKKRKWDFSKCRRWTIFNFYSKGATKNNLGSKIAKAIIPENSVKGVIEAVVPLGKAAKWAKAGYNYLTKNNKA